MVVVGAKHLQCVVEVLVVWLGGTGYPGYLKQHGGHPESDECVAVEDGQEVSQKCFLWTPKVVGHYVGWVDAKLFGKCKGRIKCSGLGYLHTWTSET